MTDILLIGDTERTMELRHEVPVQIGDSFFYAEVGGKRHVIIWSAEVPRLEAVALDAEIHPLEVLKLPELIRQGLDVYELRDGAALRAVRHLGIQSAVVNHEFPLAIADHLRAAGIELTVDQRLFDDRRRVKSSHELAGIRRAQKAAEAGMASAAELLRRATPVNGGRAVDGETLTCELLKHHVERAFAANGCTAEGFVVSHGSQTAIGHDMGSGPISVDDVVLLDLFPKDVESGCFADMTRTFVVGEAPQELRDYHALCLEALELCHAAIRPGVTGKELHEQVSEFFESHGQPTSLSTADGEVLRDGFFHATGHGVGLSVHEQPSIARVGEPFVPGDVLAIEPGLYRHGSHGVRLEDLVLVTADGCEVLTDYPYGLEP